MFHGDYSQGEVYKISLLLKSKHNKQFKSDSPRLAFLVCVWFSVYGVQIECRDSVAHTLIGR